MANKQSFLDLKVKKKMNKIIPWGLHYFDTFTSLQKCQNEI